MEEGAAARARRRAATRNGRAAALAPVRLDNAATPGARRSRACASLRPGGRTRFAHSRVIASVSCGLCRRSCENCRVGWRAARACCGAPYIVPKFHTPRPQLSLRDFESHWPPPTTCPMPPPTTGALQFDSWRPRVRGDAEFRAPNPADRRGIRRSASPLTTAASTTNVGWLRPNSLPPAVLACNARIAELKRCGHPVLRRTGSSHGPAGHAHRPGPVS